MGLGITATIECAVLPVASGVPQYQKPKSIRTISLRFLSIILRVLRLEVFVYNVYITLSNHFWPGGGGGNLLVG
jgi:hypothetical protein